MKFSNLFEREWYRGEGLGSSTNSYITWWAEEEKIARGYASARGGPNSVKKKTFEPKHPLNLGSDKRRLTASSFVADVMTSMRKSGLPLVRDTQLPAINIFKNNFGGSTLDIIDFWKDEKSKKITSEFLKVMGFDAIFIEEGGVLTIGELK